MALLAVLAGDGVLEMRLAELLEPGHTLALSHSWGGLRRVVLERPVTIVILDLGAISSALSLEGALLALRSQFPHLGLLLLVRKHRDPFTLFRLGKAGIQDLLLLGVEGLESELARALARAGENGAASLVTRFLSPYLPRRLLRVVRLAMDSVHRRWSVEEMAEVVGLARPYLSECLKESGLPSLGHLHLWARLFHAGHWLEEPGRTGESVGRQLEYSSGAAFRRALKHYTGATPTQIREGGGLVRVLRSFLLRTRLPASAQGFRAGLG